MHRAGRNDKAQPAGAADEDVRNVRVTALHKRVSVACGMGSFLSQQRQREERAYSIDARVINAAGVVGGELVALAGLGV